MTNALNFEDLLAWQKARNLAGIVYGYTRKERFSKDFGLSSQIQRASGSIMHNLAEGLEASTDTEKSRFFTMARRSVSEVQSELYLALDVGYITEEELGLAYDIATEIKRMINGLVRYLRQGKSIGELNNSEYVTDGE